MYTDRQIQEAFDAYCKRIDSIRDVLRLGPLNEHGIETMVHSGDRFLVVEWLQQQMAGGIIEGTCGEKIRVCQELVLSKNPDLPKDENLVPDIYAGMPLDAETDPFFMVSYHDRVWDYVLANAETERALPKARLMRTKNDISFILAKEADVNDVFPFSAVFR